MVEMLGLAIVILSFGAFNALVPLIVILILLVAAAGATRGYSIFNVFGIATLAGMSPGSRASIAGKSSLTLGMYFEHMFSEKGGGFPAGKALKLGAGKLIAKRPFAGKGTAVRQRIFDRFGGGAGGGGGTGGGSPSSLPSAGSGGGGGGRFGRLGFGSAKSRILDVSSKIADKTYDIGQTRGIKIARSAVKWGTRAVLLGAIPAPYLLSRVPHARKASLLRKETTKRKIEDRFKTILEGKKYTIDTEGVMRDAENKAISAREIAKINKNARESVVGGNAVDMTGMLKSLGMVGAAILFPPVLLYPVYKWAKKQPKPPAEKLSKGKRYEKKAKEVVEEQQRFAAEHPILSRYLRAMGTGSARVSTANADGIGYKRPDTTSHMADRERDEKSARRAADLHEKAAHPREEASAAEEQKKRRMKEKEEKDEKERRVKEDEDRRTKEERERRMKEEEDKRTKEENDENN